MPRRVRHEVGPGRPRADWDRDPRLVREWCAWALRDGMSPSTVLYGRSQAKNLHRFLVSRHGRDYYRPDHGVDAITWEDAYAYKDHLIARVQAGEISPKTGVLLWQQGLNWFRWRARFNPQDADAVATWNRIDVFKSAKDFPSPEDLDTGSAPYEIEHFHQVVDASRTEFLEDFYMVMLGAYTGQRAQIAGLRWDDVHWDDPDPRTHEIVARTKGGKLKRFPLLAPLESALREFRAQQPPRRQVFELAEYPWDDKIPATGSCAYEDRKGTCAETEGLKLHYGRERDETYCRPHHMRVLAMARASNWQLVRRCMARVEANLHARNPELLEEILDRRTGSMSTGPVHVHWHRFRKTLGTWYEEFGLPEALVAKIVGWTELRTLREKYHRPARRRIYEAASKVDLVEASRAAARGEDVHAKSEFQQVLELLNGEREERHRMAEENRQLRNQVAQLLEQLRTGVVRPDVQDEVTP